MIFYQEKSTDRKWRSITVDSSKSESTNYTEEKFSSTEYFLTEKYKIQDIPSVYENLRKSVIYILQDIAFIAKMPLKNKNFSDFFLPEIFSNKLLKLW